MPCASDLGGFCLLPNGVKCDILYLAKGKRDYRVAALVIPIPTPECPGDRLGDMIAQSRFLGKSGGGFLSFSETGADPSSSTATRGFGVQRASP